MPAYVCRYGTPDGLVVSRTIDAPDESAARAEVSRQGGHVLAIESRGGRSSWLFGPAPVRGGGAVAAQAFVVFNQELAALLKAGMPVVGAFDVLLERQPDARFKLILQDIREQLVSGTALSDAFASHGDAFPRLYASSLKAGERSGEVEAVLRRYLTYQKMLGAVRRKVVSALIYPILLIALSAGLLATLLSYVVPKFTEFYTEFGGELPVLTRGVILVSNVAHDQAVPGLIVLFVGGFLLRQWIKTDRGRIAFDAFLLEIPLVGGILHQFAIAQFTRSLATLIGAGTPLVPSLEIAGGAIGNRRVSAAVESVVPKVREGAELWRSLEQTGQLTSLTIEMIKVGEATGALEEMLTNASDFYDESIEAALERLINIIEPAVLVVMGGLIAGILLSVYLPIFTLISNVKT